MKGKTRDKLLLLCLVLLCVCMGLFLCALALRLTDAARVAAFVSASAGNLFYDLLLMVVGLLFLALPLCVLFAALRRRKAGDSEPSVTIRQGENGALEISAAALQAIIKQYCAANGAVRSCTGRVETTAQKPVVKLGVAFVPEADIIQEISALQSGLRAHLEKTCGLLVSGVDVEIVPGNE